MGSSPFGPTTQLIFGSGRAEEAVWRQEDGADPRAGIQEQGMEAASIQTLCARSLFRFSGYLLSGQPILELKAF